MAKLSTKNVVTRKDFEELVHACRNYDAFTIYIDNYRQQEQAEEANRCYDKWFCEIMINYDIQDEIAKNNIKYGVPSSLTNLADKTAEKLEDWLNNIGLEVEAEAETQKRVWTEEEIKNLIQTNDTVLYGALKKLYAEQTADEKRAGETTHNNGVGFNGADSKFLSNVSEFLIKRGFLTDKQKFVVRKKLVKYNKQLTRLANA